MKKVLTTLMTLTVVFSIFSIFALLVETQAIALPWRDDFDYETMQEMGDAGWRLYNENMLSVGGGTLVIDNDGSRAGSAYYLNHFPDNVHDFKVEDKIMWIGRNFGGPRVLVETQSHSYMWWADADYREYVFSRDGVKVLRFGEYIPQLNVWQIFSLEKIGSTFYLYQDGELKNTYVESDGLPDALVGVGVFSHIRGTLKYDYISVVAKLHVPAIVDLDPDTLNSKSQGQWITAYIELPEGYNVNDIDVNSILLNDTIPVDVEAPVNVGDQDLDSILDLMVKFDRASIIEWLGTNDYSADTGKSYLATFTIKGKVLDFTFEGSDIIKVLHE